MSTPSDSTLVRVYVWQIPVRATHWLIVASIVVLSVTGLFIGAPFMTVSGRAGEWFVMGWMRIIHLVAALTFMTAVLVRVIWMFTGNNYAHWDKFVPVHRSRQRGMLPTFMFYSFLRDKPPGYVGHNPLAGAGYIAVFGLYFVAIVTGLTIWGASADVSSPVRWFAGLAPLLGGLQTTRWIHHIVMWLLLGFAVQHVYSAVLMSTVEKTGTMESIFTGFKWVPKHQLGPGRYRWINHGRVDE